MDLSKSYEYFQPEKNDVRIHVIGCGSVGSTVAENLVRMGITNLTIWDMDVVEAHNLANQMFRQKDIGKPKVDAVAEILAEINPDITGSLQLKPNGWTGQLLCVDNIELRRQIVEKHMNSKFIKAMFDFRTRLEDAQHYAADWSDARMKDDFLRSMQFSHDEAKEETPVSACNVTLGVCPTVRVICAYGVSNFINFWNGKPLKKLILADAFNFVLDAF